MVRELHESLRRNDIALAVPIESRIKSWTSIEDNLEKDHFHGASLAELHDFVGIRLILLFQRDVSRACDLVDQLFDTGARRDRRADLSIDQFGYQSVHVLARPPANWLTIPSFSAFRHLEAEVQVRTLAQHMWAAASHKLQYKQEEAVPPEIRRTVHRVAALLESVDLEFERVLTERDTYRATATDAPADRALNADLLHALLDQMLPRANREGFESYSVLFWELDQLGVTTVGEFTDIVRRHLPKAIAKDEESVKQLRARGATDPRTLTGVYYSHAGLVRMILEAQFGDDYYSRIWNEAETRERERKARKPAG